MATAKKGKPPRGNRPLEEVSDEREQQAWELRQKKFWSQAHIAEELGVSQQAVSKMLLRAGKKLATEFKNRAEAIKAEQTMMLEAIVDEAKQEWERSKLPIQKRSSKQQVLQRTDGSDAEADPDVDAEGQVYPFGKAEVTLTTEGRLGDPRYLAEARSALGEIRKIWGAEAPQKTEVETKHSGNLTFNSPTLEKAAAEHSTWREQMLADLKAAREQSQKTVGEMPNQSSETDD